MRTDHYRKVPRVLVALSHSARRTKLTRALRAAGCRVAAAPDGYRLLRLLSRDLLAHALGGRPDLIVVDATMPGCNGLSILQGLRQLGWTTPVYIVVEYNQGDFAQRAFALGATRVFEKPIDVEQVCAAACALVQGISAPLPGRPPAAAV